MLDAGRATVLGQERSAARLQASVAVSLAARSCCLGYNWNCEGNVLFFICYVMCIFFNYYYETYSSLYIIIALFFYIDTAYFRILYRA